MVFFLCMMKFQCVYKQSKIDNAQLIFSIVVGFNDMCLREMDHLGSNCTFFLHDEFSRCLYETIEDI